MVRTVRATRYVTPLREGGSLPAIVEADDDGLYVLKFRGAGQGPRALIAELLGGEIGRHLGLPIPEIVLVELDPVLARSEGDPEIKELIEASAGLNLALDYLPGSLAYDPAAREPVAPEFAADVVWFDAFIMNVDRTARNTNILCWHREPWLIDHGASLYFHHRWAGAGATAVSRFPQVRDHVLLPRAAAIEDSDTRLRSRLDRAVLTRLTGLIPAAWLDADDFAGPDEVRSAYVETLLARLRSDGWVEEAIDARRHV